MIPTPSRHAVAPTQSAAANCATPVPARAGIGLRHPHVAAFLDHSPAVGWVEVHSENYLVPIGRGGGGPRLRALERIRRAFPVRCHGVGLSLGSIDGLDPAHLARLRTLFDRIEPALVSEHAAWSVIGEVYLNDLLPLPYPEERSETRDEGEAGVSTVSPRWAPYT